MSWLKKHNHRYRKIFKVEKIAKNNKNEKSAKNIIIFFGDYKKQHTFALRFVKNERPVRLGVRTPGFHPGNRGSIPLRATKETRAQARVSSFCAHCSGVPLRASEGIRSRSCGNGCAGPVPALEPASGANLNPAVHVYLADARSGSQ